MDALGKECQTDRFEMKKGSNDCTNNDHRESVSLHMVEPTI